MNAKRPIKTRVPKLVIWWKSLKRHPLNISVGEEVFAQRTRRHWSYDDVHDATGISKSHLWNIEHGLHTLSLDVILALEAVFDMVPNGLLILARRRMMKKPTILQMIRSV